MSDQSGSIHFRALFESALQAYEAKTGIALPEHPLTLQLRSCYSIESITTFLQDQIRGSSDFRGNDKAMDLVKSTTTILSTLSTTAAFDWAIGLVCPKALNSRFISLTVFVADILTRGCSTCWPCYPICCTCLSLVTICVTL